MEVESILIIMRRAKRPEVHKAIEALNSMTPIWKKNKSELKDEDYNNFYMEKF